MFESIEIMRVARSVADYAAERQSVIARNVANADTPGYRARDLPEFDQIFSRPAGLGLRQTREGHIAAGSATTALAPQIDTDAEMSPDGNSVSLEREMVRSVENGRQHDLALAVYSSSLGILRTSIGRR